MDMNPDAITAARCSSCLGALSANLIGQVLRTQLGSLFQLGVIRRLPAMKVRLAA
jgi:hypothetical protein